jgi:hypothetical protein
VLEHVIISLDRYEMGLASRGFLHSQMLADEATRSVRSTKYRQGAYDQAVLPATGLDRELLTQALRNLPNLKTVGLRDYK